MILKNLNRSQFVFYSILIFIIILSLQELKAQFGMRQPISKSASLDTPRKLVLEDLDNDNDVDLVVASENDWMVTWYENIDGLHFDSQKLVASEQFVRTVAVGDFDGDGDKDAVTAPNASTPQTASFYWYENSNGIFSKHSLVDTLAFYVSNLIVADMDSDNDDDIVATLSLNNTSNAMIIWYRNIDGVGNFQAVNTNINTYFPVSANSIIVRDIDGDFDQDIIATIALSESNFRLVWFENIDGNGIFNSGNVIRSRDYSSIQVGDIDNDNDNDIVAIDEIDDKIHWFENLDGNGNYNTGRMVPDPLVDIESLYLSDLNEDDDLDLLVGAGGQVTLSWFENSTSSYVFEYQGQIANTSGDYVVAVDIDQDNDNDVVDIDYSAGVGSVVWIENEDNSNEFGPLRNIIKETWGPSAVFTTDFDNDGDLDVISGSSGDSKIALYENSNRRGSWGLQKTIAFMSPSVFYVSAVDINNSGFDDILAASSSVFSSSNEIIWFKNNDGSGTFNQGNLIGGYPDNSGISAIAYGDIDNNGYQDIVVAEKQNDRSLGWYKNNGASGFETFQVIENTSATNSIFISDLDQDNDLDIGIYSGWFENVNGNGLTWSFNSVWSGSDISPGDLDKDGDLDIVSGQSDRIEWYENLGSGNFGSAQTISNLSNSALVVLATDIDLDGDSDVIASSSSNPNGNLAWFENLNGSGTQWSEDILQTGDFYIRSITTGDLEDDGDIDIFTASGDDFVAWYENLTIVGIEDKNFSKENIRYDLAQNYPNPFNPSTTISYSLPELSTVTITIYNQLGQKIKALLNQNQPVGIHQIQWDGKNEFGQSLSSGIYFYHLKAGAFTQTKKMILLK